MQNVEERKNREKMQKASCNPLLYVLSYTRKRDTEACFPSGGCTLTSESFGKLFHAGGEICVASQAQREKLEKGKI